ARLAEQLAPGVIADQDGTNEPPLQILVRVRDDRRGCEHGAEPRRRPGRAGLGELGIRDRRQVGGEPLAEPRRRPRRLGPSSIGESLEPGPERDVPVEVLLHPFPHLASHGVGVDPAVRRCRHAFAPFDRGPLVLYSTCMSKHNGRGGGRTSRRTRGGWRPAGTAAARRAGHGERATAKGLRTRDELLAAARRVFERDGYLDTRVADIAAAAKLAHGSFYTYFSSKQEVFLAIVRDVGRQIRDAVAPSRADAELDAYEALDRANP